MSRRALDHVLSKSLSLAFALLIAVAMLTVTLADSPSPGADERAPHSDATRTHAALRDALRTNIDYLEQWARSGDFDSAAETAAGVVILAELLHARTGHAADGNPARMLLDAAARLQTATRAKDSNRTNDQIRRLRDVLNVSESWPIADSFEAPRVSASMKHLMLLVDGTFADAKAELAVGDVAAAKSAALTLAELACLVRQRKGDTWWRQLSDQMAADAHAFAATDQTDPALLRAMLRGVYTRCEACHDRR
jgi:hypothetical protein